MQAQSTEQLTVRGLPKDVSVRLRKEARARGWSLNRTVVYFLRKAAGLEDSKPVLHDDLDALLGSWTAAEGKAFDKALKRMRRIDSDVWS